MMIDITIATIGRLTKKRAMVYFASPAGWRPRRPLVGAGAGFGRDGHAVAESRCSPSTTTCSPGLSPSSMTQSVSTRGPTFTLRNATLLSRVDHRHAVEVLQFLHGALRNEQRAGLGVEQQPRPAVLARAAAASSGLGNIELDAQRAGRRDRPRARPVRRVPVCG